MLDWLAVWGVAQAVGFVFKPILEDLAKDTAKDWAKDLLKGIPGKILEKLKKEDVEIAAGKALKEFLQLMQQQLKVRCKLSEADIKEYTVDIKKFISDQSVKENLGKAFDINCDSLDSKTLEDSWRRLLLKPLPSKFNWQLFTEQYFTQVQELLLESEELRSFLELQKLSSIDQTLKENADIPKDFDLPGYSKTIRERYGNLKLDSLDATSRENPINLWQIFITQNVREAYQGSPELSKDYLRKLQASNQLDAGWEIERDKEELEDYKRNYLQQPIRSVLDVIREKRSKNYLVILGDPGSGKSTLLQYLALDWVEQALDKNNFDELPIPLLIELRYYVRDRTVGECKDFLEYYHKGPNCFYHLNQHKLHQQLKAGNALVMFDGLDEIFDLEKREEVITCIHRFTNEYPDVQVIVTSRIIGYQQQALQDAEFRHFMLQDLEAAQIEDFIERWHNRTFNKAEEQDKDFKRETLQRAIKESKPIAELARNLLLLTMMAILNLKRKLPRDRELPRDRSQLYKDASEVLLQNWDARRNLKPDERLDILDYQDKQAMLRQVAYHMQTRNKGLAGNTIIHKDDLEVIFRNYLQSIPVSDDRDIARRLIKQLRIRNFILCFMGENYYAFVHRSFLEYFCALEFFKQFEKRGTANGLTLEELKTDVFGKYWQDETWHEVLLLIAGMMETEFVGEILEYLMALDGEEENFVNLFLAAKCLAEVRNRSVIASTADKLLGKLKDLTKYNPCYYSYEEETKLVQQIRTQAIISIASNYKDDTSTFLFLQQCIHNDDKDVRCAAVEALASNYKDDARTFSIVQQCVHDDDRDMQHVAASALASNYKDDTRTFSFFQQCAQDDGFALDVAVWALANYYKDDIRTFTFFQQCIQDDDSYVRYAAVRTLADYYKDDTRAFPIFQQCIQDDDSYVRYAAVDALAKHYKDNTRAFPIFQQCIQDDDSYVRYAAVNALANNYKDDIRTFPFLQQWVKDDNSYVRSVALYALGKSSQSQLDLLDIYYDCAVNDPFQRREERETNPRRIALEIIIKQFPQHPDTLPLLRDRAENDPDKVVREYAEKQLQQWRE
jgi:predicted NACHT family NTPase